MFHFLSGARTAAAVPTASPRIRLSIGRDRLAEGQGRVLLGGHGYVGTTKGAACGEIKAYVLEKYGMKIFSL